VEEGTGGFASVIFRREDHGEPVCQPLSRVDRVGTRTQVPSCSFDIQHGDHPIIAKRGHRILQQGLWRRGWIRGSHGSSHRIVEKIAEQEHVPLIDTRPSLDGKWDDDLFLDPIHFTQKGANAIAKEMFVGLLPILRGDENMRCTEQ